MTTDPFTPPEHALTRQKLHRNVQTGQNGRIGAENNGKL